MKKCQFNVEDCLLDVSMLASAYGFFTKTQLPVSPSNHGVFKKHLGPCIISLLITSGPQSDHIRSVLAVKGVRLWWVSVM